MRDLTRDPSMMYVQEEVQTFLDNLMIHHHGWVSRRWHNPVRDPDGPVICKDRPWEHLTYFSLGNSSILRDPEDGLFKCWYEDLVLDRDRLMESVVPHGSRQLYAESEDGIEWRGNRSLISSRNRGTRPISSSAAVPRVAGIPTR